MNPIADPRIAAGMMKQLAARREKIAAGETPLGWKVGLSTPAARQAIGTDAPMVASMLRGGLVTSGAQVSLRGFVKPVAEPEIAVHIGRDLGPMADDTTVRSAIAALGPAFELVDFSPALAPENLEAILATGMFHRHVILGPADPSRAGGNVAGLRTRLWCNGALAAETTDLEANTGKLIDIVRHVATTLAACGEGLRAGEVVIAGSITAPLPLEGGDREIVHDLDPIGSVSVSLGA